MTVLMEEGRANQCEAATRAEDIQKIGGCGGGCLHWTLRHIVPLSSSSAALSYY